MKARATGEGTDVEDLPQALLRDESAGGRDGRRGGNTSRDTLPLPCVVSAKNVPPRVIGTAAALLTIMMGL